MAGPCPGGWRLLVATASSLAPCLSSASAPACGSICRDFTCRLLHAPTHADLPTPKLPPLVFATLAAPFTYNSCVARSLFIPVTPLPAMSPAHAFSSVALHTCVAPPPHVDQQLFSLAAATVVPTPAQSLPATLRATCLQHTWSYDDCTLLRIFFPFLLFTLADLQNKKKFALQNDDLCAIGFLLQNKSRFDTMLNFGNPTPDNYFLANPCCNKLIK
jgi:hypothetical protein